MSITNCINLCEILSIVYDKDNTFTHIIKKIMTEKKMKQCKRIYIGSYFCSQYFLYMKEEHILELINGIKEYDMNITIVIPIITEKYLEAAKNKIDKMISKLSISCDEITVNDYGMLDYIGKKYTQSINLGRLFMKDYRDPRYEDYFLQTYETRVFTNYMKSIVSNYKIKSCEWDLTHEVLNLSNITSGIEIAIHRPYSYMTVGHICEIGSINKEISKKYRPNEACKKECETHFISYDFEMDREWLKFGRALYYNNDDCFYDVPTGKGNREIYFPIKEVLI